MERFFVVAKGLFLLLLDVLIVGDLLDGGNASCFDGFLEVELRPDGLLLLLQCEEF